MSKLQEVINIIKKKHYLNKKEIIFIFLIIFY